MINHLGGGVFSNGVLVKYEKEEDAKNKLVISRSNKETTKAVK